jgi:hypothetical protein
LKWLNTTIPGLGKATDVFDNTKALEMKIKKFGSDAKRYSFKFLPKL